MGRKKNKKNNQRNWRDQYCYTLYFIKNMGDAGLFMDADKTKYTVKAKHLARHLPLYEDGERVYINKKNAELVIRERLIVENVPKLDSPYENANNVHSMSEYEADSFGVPKGLKVFWLGYNEIPKKGDVVIANLYNSISESVIGAVSVPQTKGDKTLIAKDDGGVVVVDTLDIIYVVVNPEILHEKEKV